MSIRRLTLLVLAVAALAGASSASAAPTFVVVGHGFGHGVGMSQYGAYGYALKGFGYRKILDAYFPGTTTARKANLRIRVLLDGGRRKVTLASPVSWKVTAANGTWTMSPGSRTIGPGLKVTAGGKTRTVASPATFSATGSGLLTVDGRPYRGRIVLIRRVAPGGERTLRIVNDVSLELYLRGVVPYEMPAAWSMAALRAQAVAARSYALSHIVGGDFDVYDDTRSQVYGGYAAENPRSTQAVDSTAGEVRTYGGSVASTFFYSSSGGWTANASDVWGGSVPYLQSRRDPYDSAGGRNPNSTWAIPYSAAALASKLGSRVRGSLVDARVSVDASHRAGTVTLVGTKGTTAPAGSVLRTALGLRSTFFRIGVLKIGAAKSTISKGKGVYLTGLARGAAAAWLERRRSGERWRKVADLKLASNKSFRIFRRPRVTTSYRVVAQKIHGARLGAPVASGAKTIRVAARAALYRPADRSGLSGFLDTREPGARVAIQQLGGGKWKTVATGTTDSAGRFRVGYALEDGTYRAVVLRDGRATGATAPVTVVAPGP